MVRVWRNERGAAALEFALVAPMFLACLIGIIGYGSYFWRAHAIQQVANDAARAALPGVTANERRALATAAVADELPRLAGIDRTLATTEVSEAGGAIVVAIAYDATRDALLTIGFVPMPDKRIRRTAAVRLGGL